MIAQITNYYSNKSTVYMRDACKTGTSTMITSPKTKRTITESMIIIIIRGIKEKSTLIKVLTPRNLEWRRRVLS